MHKLCMQFKSQSRDINSIYMETRYYASSDTLIKVIIKGGKSTVALNQRICISVEKAAQDPESI